jgi:DNA-binding phage protein
VTVALTIVLCSVMPHNLCVSGRQSEAVTKALAMVAKGMSAYAAAKRAGIALSTIYRALKRHREAQ